MTRFIALLALVALLPFAPSAQAQSAFTQAQMDAAPECAKGRDLEEGENTLCACKERGFDRFIWGTGPYSGHSDVCTAARHAGLITKADGGMIVATGLPGQREYTEGEANGIKGRKWGRYSSSFDVALASTFGAAATPNLLACQAFSAPAAPYDCACPAGRGNTGSVWGTGPYTGDSDICSAARQTGVVGEAGGPVRITAEPGQDSYEGAQANGVTSRSWGSYQQSFMVRPLQARANGLACGTMPNGTDLHTCVCPANHGFAGSVWGSGPYTADSDICTAARHAGVVGAQGGAVSVLRVRGLPGYLGSSANGAKTADWGGFDTSIVFNGN